MEELSKQILAVLTDVYGKSPWTQQQIAADLAKPEADYFFVYDGKDIVGFLSLQHLVGELELTNIAVKKAFQGHGLSKQLMTFLEGLDQPIFLEVRASNRIAQNLYERYGFVTVGKRQDYYHEPLEDAILMKREGSRN